MVGCLPSGQQKLIELDLDMDRGWKKVKKGTP